MSRSASTDLYVWENPSEIDWEIDHEKFEELTGNFDDITSRREILDRDTYSEVSGGKRFIAFFFSGQVIESLTGGTVSVPPTGIVGLTITLGIESVGSTNTLTMLARGSDGKGRYTGETTDPSQPPGRTYKMFNQKPGTLTEINDMADYNAFRDNFIASAGSGYKGYNLLKSSAPMPGTAPFGIEIDNQTLFRLISNTDSTLAGTTKFFLGIRLDDELETIPDHKDYLILIAKKHNQQQYWVGPPCPPKRYVINE